MPKLNRTFPGSLSQPVLGNNRQRHCLRKLNFRAAEDLDVRNLDAWWHYLADDTLDFDDIQFTREFPADSYLAAIWFERILALSRQALLAVSIPCFGQIELLQCRPISKDRRMYEAVIALPELENYSGNPFETALQCAFSCTYYMQGHPPNDAIIEHQFRRIENELLGGLRKGVAYSSINFRILHTAYRMGLPFWSLGVGVSQLGWGSSSILIDRTTTSSDAPMSNKLTKYKHVTANILRTAGLPVSKHSLVSTHQAAEKVGELLGWPVVVKPADLERGEGVQVDVGPENLGSALKYALRSSTLGHVLVEQQVKGVCHRLFISKSQLLYAVKRLPIGVYGDGVQSIASLVDLEATKQRRKPPWLRSNYPVIDEIARRTLAAAGFVPSSVPDRGKFVPLRRIETTEWGGVDEDVTNIVHPENLRIALVAAALCGLNVAGVDLITEDISVPWMENGAVISEVNFAPSIGAGEISRRHLAEYVRRLAGSGVRIPVDVFVGGADALEAGKTLLKNCSGKGMAVYLTGDTYTLGPMGQEIPMTVACLHDRVKALMLNRQVEALIILIQSDSILDYGLPLEGVDAVHWIGEPGISIKSDRPAERHRKLRALLSQWVWP